MMPCTVSQLAFSYAELNTDLYESNSVHQANAHLTELMQSDQSPALYEIPGHISLTLQHRVTSPFDLAFR